jgi:hypothetical protein
MLTAGLKSKMRWASRSRQVRFFFKLTHYCIFDILNSPRDLDAPRLPWKLDFNQETGLLPKTNKLFGLLDSYALAY